MMHEKLNSSGRLKSLPPSTSHRRSGRSPAGSAGDAVRYVLAQADAGVRTYRYVHGDALGTPLRVTDQGGTVVWQASYDPFGLATINPDPDSDGIQQVLNLRFPGQYYDAETGLHYNYFRDYDARLGRYIQSDPIGLIGGLNTYAYVGGNPISRIDPMGLYGSQSCNYYSQVCAANGGFYECRVALQACNTFPKKRDYFDCVRQCLQEKHKKGQPEPNSCSVNNNIGLGDNAADHAKCLSGCMANPENPYDPKGPDLPDADVDLIR